MHATSKIDKHKIRRIYLLILAAAVVVIVLCLTYARLYYNDCYSKSTSIAGYTDLTELSEDDLKDSDYVLYAEGLQQQYFYSGTYQIIVEATTISDDAYCQVIDLWTNTILAEFDYTPGDNTHEFQFTTEKNYEYVVVRSYVAADDIIAVLDEGGDTSEILNIASYTLRSDGVVCSDAIWTIVFFLLIFILLGYGAYRMVRKKKPALLIVTVMTLAASLPFFNDYLPYGHDYSFHLSRIFSLGQSFPDGQIPQHINESMSTAGITSILYPELVLYFAGFLCAAGTTAWFGLQASYILITFFIFLPCYASTEIPEGNREFRREIRPKT